MDTITYHITISGQVQGVAFRHYTKSYADRIHVSGWVRNRPDGSVETVISGSRQQVDDMIAWLHTGSPFSVVTDVSVSETQQDVRSGSFEILY